MRLRDLRSLGFHPRRQAPIGDYIVDFSFRKQRLAIEIDGGHHGGPSDIARDAVISSLGYQVLRFWNSDVDANIDGVLEIILTALERHVSRSLP